ncbi:MAG: hypothetical protein L0I62_00605 [Gammaproteobacteria bacterium]|nr:hypothetical protein [Gammaproteobacteria bacterium]
MSKHFGLPLASLLLCAVTIALLPAPGVYAASSGAAQASPSRGMTMAEVRARFGDPQRIMPPDPATAQGPLKPPIIRWVYPDYTVYFERSIVIHTVWTDPRKAPPLTTTPAVG